VDPDLSNAPILSSTSFVTFCDINNFITTTTAMDSRASSGPAFVFGDQGDALRSNGLPFTFRARGSNDRGAPNFLAEAKRAKAARRERGSGRGGRGGRGNSTGRGSGYGPRPKKRAADRELFNAPRETTPEQMDEMREGNARFKDLADVSESDASMELSSSIDGSGEESEYEI